MTGEYETTTELTMEDHFRRLELMARKYAGGDFVMEGNERHYRIAQLSGAEETELYCLNKMLTQSHEEDQRKAMHATD